MHIPFVYLYIHFVICLELFYEKHQSLKTF